VQAVSPDGIPEKILEKMHRKTDAAAKKIRANAGRTGVSLQGRFWFMLLRLIHAHLKEKPEPDYSYWEARGWHGKVRPWKQAQ